MKQNSISRVRNYSNNKIRYTNGLKITDPKSSLLIGLGNDITANWIFNPLLNSKNKRLYTIRETKQPLWIFMLQNLLSKFGTDTLINLFEWELWKKALQKNTSIVYPHLFVVFIFDWDDTLLCTSFLSSLHFNDLSN